MASRDEVAALLADRIETLVRELIPEGSRSGHYWIGRPDRKSGSFWVNLPGARSPGTWKDAVSDEKGGPIDLIMRCQNCDFKAAMAWARDWLGLGNDDTRQVREKLEAARVRASQNVVSHDEKRLKDAAVARAVYLKSKREKFLESPADHYLRGRGIDVRRLGRMPGVLGWVPAQHHVESNTEWPVMVAGFQNDAGETVAVHRTFLSNCSGAWRKAPVDPPRKIWPSFMGCAIRLWRGDSGLSIEDAAKAGLRETLVLCEGVEDGLALALAEPGFRVWCAGSLGNLSHIKLPECIDEVVLAADNDWGKRQAAALLDKAVLALARQGARVRVARSHFGKDANDALLSAQEG